MMFAGAGVWLRLLALVAVALALVSCQYLDDVLPTIQAPIDSAQPSATPLDESPRLRERQDIPPTWTPPVNQSSETPITPSEIVPEAGELTRYTVQAGDTLAAIAQRFNVSLEDLARLNNIEDFDHIEVDQVLIIPGF